MRHMARWAVVIIAFASGGCLIPRFILTETEIIRPVDSTAVFGPRGEVRIPGFEEVLRIKWDSAGRTYLPDPAKSAFGYTGLRVARLRGDAFLVQVSIPDQEDLLPGFRLMVMRVTAAGDATPLGCEISAATAAKFGVVLRPPQDADVLDKFVSSADGQRADIIEMLRSQLPACLPLTRFDNFAPPMRELDTTRQPGSATNSAIAVRARKVGCRPCPSGACVLGAVTDEADLVVPGVATHLRAEGGKSLALARTNGEGRFFISGAPAGSNRLTLELPGFATTRIAKAFVIRSGRTYAFETPLIIRVAARDGDEEETDLMPFECPVYGAPPS